MSLHGTTFTRIWLSDLFQNKLLLKFVVLPWRFKIYILQGHNGLCMHNFLTKKYGMCDLYCQGYVFKSSRKILKSFRPVELHFY